MNMLLEYKNNLLLICLATSISACSGTPAPIEINSQQKVLVLVNKNAPAWVNNGSGMLHKQDSRMFIGVASAVPAGDMAQQKAEADDKARAEVSRVLASYMVVVAKDYAGACLSPSPVPQQLNNAEKIAMANARIIASWRDPQSNSIWVMSELDMKYVKDALPELTNSTIDVKGFFESNADVIFDRLNKDVNIQ